MSEHCYCKISYRDDDRSQPIGLSCCKCSDSFNVWRTMNYPVRAAANVAAAAPIGYFSTFTSSTAPPECKP